MQASREGSWLSRSFARSFRNIESALGKMRRHRHAEDGTGRLSQQGYNESTDAPSDRGYVSHIMGYEPSQHSRISPSSLTLYVPTTRAEIQWQLQPSPLLELPSPTAPSPEAVAPALPASPAESKPELPTVAPSRLSQPSCWGRLVQRRQRAPKEQLDSAKIVELCAEISAAAAATVAAAARATAAAEAATAAAKSAEAQCMATLAVAATFKRSSGPGTPLCRTPLTVEVSGGDSPATTAVRAALADPQPALGAALYEGASTLACRLPAPNAPSEFGMPPLALFHEAPIASSRTDSATAALDRYLVQHCGPEFRPTAPRPPQPRHTALPIVWPTPVAASPSSRRRIGSRPGEQPKPACRHTALPRVWQYG